MKTREAGAPAQVGAARAAGPGCSPAPAACLCSRARERSWKTGTDIPACGQVFPALLSGLFSLPSPYP